MRHTLGEFLGFYNPERVQLVIAEHSIVIDTNLEGSNFIIRNFKDSKFYLVENTDGLLILNINE